MAEWRMLRQVMSPSDIYAHAEPICEMLREQYGSYDADVLEEVMVDDAFTQRLKGRGYDLLGEGGESAEATSFQPRRDGARTDGGSSMPVRRPPADRSLPIRRAPTNDGVVPMRRRDHSNDGGVPLRRGERGGDGGMTPRRRDGAPQNDGVGQMRRRDGTPQSGGTPLRRRDMRSAGDASVPPTVDAPSNLGTPRRSWDSSREEGVTSPRRDEARTPAPRVEPPLDLAPTEDLQPPVVEAPAQPTLPVAPTQPDAPVVEASSEEAPPVKPAPRTRRTTRARTKADPDAAAS